MMIGVNKPILALAVVAILYLTTCVWAFAPCEAHLSCEEVQAIHVGKGRQHLAGGVTKIFYEAFVLVNTAKSSLKEVYATCPNDTITIRVGDNVMPLPKAAVSSGGDWFGIDRPTPQEALDAARGMCPDKVISHLPGSLPQDNSETP